MKNRTKNKSFLIKKETKKELFFGMTDGMFYIHPRMAIQIVGIIHALYYLS